MDRKLLLCQPVSLLEFNPQSPRKSKRAICEKLSSDLHPHDTQVHILTHTHTHIQVYTHIQYHAQTHTHAQALENIHTYTCALVRLKGLEVPSLGCSLYLFFETRSHVDKASLRLSLYLRTTLSFLRFVFVF